MNNLSRLVSVALSLVLASSMACSKDDEGPAEPAGADAGATNDGAASATDAATTTDTSTTKDSATSDAATGGACNALVQEAPESTSGSVKGSAPAATGGTIANGKYFLTTFTLYDPNGTDEAQSPSGLQVTMSITGNKMDSIQTLPDGSSDTFAETFVVTGTSLARTLSCPKAAPDLAAVYSVDGNKLTIYETDPQSSLVAGSVYVKQ